MKVEFDVDKKYQDTKIIICTNKITKEVQELVEKLDITSITKIYGYKNDKIFILEENNIETIYSENKKVFIRYERGDVFESKKRIYELENYLPNRFVRISNSEIVNFDKVENLDFKIVGTIILNFYTKRHTYVSRRYVKKIREYLEI